MKYDVIAFLENFEDDFEYIVKKNNLTKLMGQTHNAANQGGAKRPKGVRKLRTRKLAHLSQNQMFFHFKTSFWPFGATSYSPRRLGLTAGLQREELRINFLRWTMTPRGNFMNCTKLTLNCLDMKQVNICDVHAIVLPRLFLGVGGCSSGLKKWSQMAIFWDHDWLHICIFFTSVSTRQWMTIGLLLLSFRP